MATGGLGFTSVLGIIFIVLKLLGVITWSWIWVLAPFWIGFVAWLAFILILVLFAGSSNRRW